jgi:predicted dehydrogenase
MTRRTLMQSAIVYKLAPALRAAPGDEVRLGFIGAGIRGTQLMSSFRVVPGVKMVAAADLYDGCLTRAGETDPGIAVGKDYRALLDRKDVDAVVIATPDHHHHRMALDAMAAGKHVYLEKPMAWSIAQCRDLYQASLRYPKLRVQTGSAAGYAALTHAARELVASGALGKVNHIRMENHRNSAQGAWVYPVPPDASPQTIDWARFLGPAPKKPFDAKVFFRWRCWWEYSGGVATDLFVHQLSQLHSMMKVEGPKSVVAQGGLFRWDDGRTVPDLLQAVYEYPGFLATLHVNMANARGTGNTTVVHGSEGTLVFEGRDKLVHYPEPYQDEMQAYGTVHWPKKLREEYLAQFRGRSTPAAKPAKEIRVENKPTPQAAFVESIRAGGAVAETAFEGYAAASGAHLANVAYKKGRRTQFEVRSGKVS